MTSTESLPKISLVTPVFNSARYIEQTIRSVLSQNYPNLEYFIIDGGSTDGSVDIIRKYESQISGWLSEPDKGMYDAINKGFSRTTGEVMGWISATDMFQVGGLRVVGSVFRDLPDVEWITGRRAFFSDDGATIRIDPLMRWSRLRFLLGASNRHIQQESTFWRRSLWEKAGGYVDASSRIASDFELWIRFFRHARLHSVDTIIGGFREHPDSGCLSDLPAFNNRCDLLADDELSGSLGVWPRRLREFSAGALRVPKLRFFWYNARKPILGAFYNTPGLDWPPVIRHNPLSGWYLDT
jgi:glycosyltransferase involved in cell wall biosynthesis